MPKLPWSLNTKYECSCWTLEGKMWTCLIDYVKLIFTFIRGYRYIHVSVIFIFALLQKLDSTTNTSAFFIVSSSTKANVMFILWMGTRANKPVSKLPVINQTFIVDCLPRPLLSITRLFTQFKQPDKKPQLSIVCLFYIINYLSEWVGRLGPSPEAN